MNKNVVTLFCGGGLKTLGAMQAGYTPVIGVEYDEAIASVYSDNIGAVTVAKVEDVDPRPYAGIDLLLASPVCTNASVANAGRGEKGTDMAAAEGVCRWLREARPERFVMENVTPYREFESCKSILRTLTELGYWWSADNCNFASHGVPQTRKRLIVRATRDAMLPALPAPTPWIGWYAAIEDILHTLPESRFAPWQLARLPSDLFESVLTRPCRYGPEERGKGEALAPEPAATVTTQWGQQRALLIEGDAAGDRPPTCGTSAEPSFTLKGATGGRVHRAFLVSNGGAHGDLFRLPGQDAPAVTGQSEGRVKSFLVEGTGHWPSQNLFRGPSDAECRMTVKEAHEPAFTLKGAGNGSRAWLEQGRVVALTPRALARLMTMPDDYKLPASRRLACTIIGNGVPCEGVRRILEGLG